MKILTLVLFVLITDLLLHTLSHFVHKVKECVFLALLEQQAYNEVIRGILSAAATYM